MEQRFSADLVTHALRVSEAVYLGSGTFGEVWSAQYNGVEAAYKIIHLSGYDAARLRREVQGYERVENEHVVRLHEVRSVELDGETRPVLIFELIEGGDLSQVNKHSLPSPIELRQLAKGLLRGIAAMHAASLLHRDLKPANVALRDGDYSRPVILDLGFAKLLDMASITTYPTLIGTTLYMAPEQLRGERALRASDLWALGEVLFEAGTGRHPFFLEGERLPMAEAFDRLNSPPEMPQNFPEDIADLIRRCLSDPPFARGTVAKALMRLEG
jgi:serine/threonine protein kinase